MMKIFSDKKILFLVFIVLMIILVALQQIFFGVSAPETQQAPPTPTPSIFIRPTYVAPTLSDPDNPPFTGQKDVPVPTEYRYVNTAYELRADLPITQPGFTLDYDYSTFKFLVTLREPIEQSRISFDAWITENGYTSIPQSEFVFQ